MSEENVNRIRHAFVRSPKKSTTHKSLKLVISRLTVLRLLKRKLRFKLQIVHHITQYSKEARFDFSKMMCVNIDEDNDYLKKLYFLTK